MLIPYDALQQLPQATLHNLIREFLFAQVEDGSFESLGDQQLLAAINQCQQALQQGKLMVEYSEDDHSFAIRSLENMAPQQN